MSDFSESVLDSIREQVHYCYRAIKVCFCTTYCDICDINIKHHSSAVYICYFRLVSVHLIHTERGVLS